MSENKTEIKQALNKVTIVGTLKEKKLEIGETKEHKKYISGELVIATSKTSFHRVHIFANQKTKDGKDNKMFKSYTTINDKYLSEAGIIEQQIPDVEPTKVKVAGELSVNDYYNNDQLFSTVQIRGKFINRIRPEEEYIPQAKFDTEMYIENIKPETKNDEETDRAIVTGIIPIYGGKVIPIDFITDLEDGVTDFVTSNFDKGDTVDFWGDIVNEIVTTTKKKKGFGKANEDVITTTKRELLITGGNPEPYEEEKAYDSETIKKALAEREVSLKELEENSKKNSKKSNKSNKSFGSTKSTSVDSETLGDEDIPF